MRTNFVKPQLIAIIGTTASGKTDLALRLAKKYHGAIISADSQQIYHHARIGTNQPKGIWRQANKKLRSVGIKKIYLTKGIPIFFIDILSPNKQWAAAKFQKITERLCRQLGQAGYQPILTGGTMLYVSSIIEGYIFPPGKPNIKLRTKLERISTAKLNQKLKALDFLTWQSIDLTNRRRLIRAIEYVTVTGRSFIQSQQRSSRTNTIVLGIKINKVKLRQAITNRTKIMLSSGLIEEVKYIRQHYPRSPLLKAIGYQEIDRYLNNQINLKQAEQNIISHTWQYARRQLHWFKKIPKVIWINSFNQALKKVKTNHPTVF